MIWGILKVAGGWLWNNKLVALCLVLLLLVTTKLTFTHIALSIKTAKVESQAREIEKQQGQITELKAIQKEQEAGIAALKLYADQIAKRKREVEKVTVYLSELDQPTVEILSHEKIKKLNSCIWGYFLAGVLPDGCMPVEGATLPNAESSKGGEKVGR